MTATPPPTEVTLIPGDGIGPEIAQATVAVLEALGAPIAWDRRLAGLAAIDASGETLPAATLDSVRRTRVALKGPLSTPIGGGYRSVNVALRNEFELYANLRPARTIIPGGRYEDIDLVLVRENLGGLYGGADHFVAQDGDPHAIAISTGINTRGGCRRIARFAFEYAVRHHRRRVTIVHKANTMKAISGIFLETAREVAKDYTGRVDVDERIVDACAMQLVRDPSRYDVLVMDNLYGDILSDLCAGLVGGLGVVPGANLGDDCAVFEAVHGSAPDLAGQGVANPTAVILSAALMLHYMGERDAARRIEAAVERLYATSDIRTRDLGGTDTTAAFTEALIRLL